MGLEMRGNPALKVAAALRVYIIALYFLFVPLVGTAFQGSSGQGCLG